MMSRFPLVLIGLLSGPTVKNQLVLSSLYSSALAVSAFTLTSPPPHTSAAPATSCEASASSQESSYGSPLRRRLLEGIESSKLDSYHLVWSTGALKKFAIGSATLLLAKAMSATFPTTITAALCSMSSSKFSILNTISSNVVLPLMASACCLLQLWINLLAGGCAGFNTVLGPVRPYFLSLLLHLTVMTAQWSSPKWYFRTFMRWSVALLPEGLHLWNVYTVQGQNNDSSDSQPAIMPFQATARLDIPTMGCVACINKINSALRADGRVVEAEAALNPLGAKGGYAVVRVASKSRDEVNEVVEKLLVSVQDAGFDPCHLQTLDIESSRQ